MNEQILIYVKNGKIAHVKSSFSSPQAKICVVDADKLVEIGYSDQEILSILDRESVGHVDSGFSVPAEAQNQMDVSEHSKTFGESTGDKILRRIENAINEVDAIRNAGYGLDSMRPALKEAWWRLHTAHEEYKKIVDTQIKNIPDSTLYCSLDVMGKSLGASGQEIKELFGDFIRKEFEWCETTAPYVSDPKKLFPDSDSMFRAYPTRGTNEGYFVTVEAFKVGVSLEPMQIFKAKTQNIKAANVLAGMVTSLLNDKVAKREIETINTVGIKTDMIRPELAKMASRAPTESSLKAAVNQLGQKTTPSTGIKN